MRKAPALLFVATLLVAPARLAQTLEGEDEPGGEPEPEPTPSASVAPPAGPTPVPRPPPPGAPLPTQGGMVRLPGGRFVMGSAEKGAPANEKPPHGVTVASFSIDRTEVTVGAYRACVEKHACAPPARSSASCTWEMGDPELPVACVHWRDADAYCRFAGKRLPRETEWEYAAHGPTHTRYPWGGTASCANAVTLLHEATGRSCAKRPAKVGTHPLGASPFGVLDLAGNVEEWTSDWYAESLAQGAAPRSGASHVLRGGGWLSPPSASRASARSWGSSLEAGPNVGFRCARDGGAP